MNQYPKRKSSPRLQNYNYSWAGFYFVTINTHKGISLFGKIKDNEVRLNFDGEVVHKAWLYIPNHHPNVILDEFIIMPNHLHGIIQIKDDFQVSIDGGSGPKNHNLSEIIKSFKIYSSRRINARRKEKSPVWHRSYYDRVIRNERELENIRKYIQENPIKDDDLEFE